MAATRVVAGVGSWKVTTLPCAGETACWKPVCGVPSAAPKPHAIRPAVVTRKVCGGNRTWGGALTQEILASVLATCRKQRLHPLRVLRQIYCSPEPLLVPFHAACRPRPP